MQLSTFTRADLESSCSVQRKPFTCSYFQGLPKSLVQKLFLFSFCECSSLFLVDPLLSLLVLTLSDAGKSLYSDKPCMDLYFGFGALLCQLTGVGSALCDNFYNRIKMDFKMRKVRRRVRGRQGLL